MENDKTLFDENLKIKLVYVEKYKYSSDWTSYIHTHPFTEIFYVLDGKGYSVINNKSTKIVKDDIFIVNPNTPHTEYSDEKEPLEYICFAIRGLSYQNEMSRVITNKKLYNTKIYFELLDYEYHLDKSNKDTVCAKLAEIILSNINHYSKLELCLYETRTTESAKARVIKDYLDNNLKSEISLDDLANVFHMNKFYLSHLFKDTYGVSPITYMINQKIRIAKDLLINSDYTVLQISETLNYNSQSYFTTLFKKNTGLTPIDFRKLHKQ